MADFDDALLTSAFAEFRSDVAPYVKPVGTHAAWETVSARKRVRVLAAVTISALFVVGPMAAYAAVTGDSHGPPARIGATSSATPSPVESTPGVTPSTGVPAPDGRISQSDLGNATLDIPAWAPDAYVRGCLSGEVKFTNGAHYILDSMHVWIDKVVYTDVDHDGAQETVAKLSCGDQTSTFQVVAFDRDTTGAIRTLGQVAVQTGAVKAICDIRTATGGAVDVKVLDLATPLRCLTSPPAAAQQQWRTFGWNGAAFVQTGGPTSFPVNPKATDLVVSTTNLAFHAPVNGLYHGTLTVTVRNLGNTGLPYSVLIDVPTSITLVAQTGCTTQTFPQGATVTCDQATLAAGASRVVAFQFTATAPVTPSFLPSVYLRVADGYANTNPDLNRPEFTITF